MKILDEQDTERYREVVSLANQANIALANKHYVNAIEGYENAIKIAKELGRSRLIAVLLNRKGQVLQAQGEIQDAVIAYESALRALDKDRIFNLELIINGLIQSFANLLTQEDKSYSVSAPEPVPDLYSAKVAQTLESDENDSTLVVKLWLDIGNAYLQQPQERPALNAYEQALQRPEINTNPVLKAYAIANIGEISRRQGKIDDAEVKLNQALRLLDQYPDPLEKRRVLPLLANIARDRGQIDRGMELYQQALELYEKANDRLGMGRAYAGLASLYLMQKQFTDAQQTYQRAVELAEAEHDNDTLWHAYWGLGCCQHVARELSEALNSFKKSLDLIKSRQQHLRTDEGKVAFLENVQDVFEKLLTVHLELAQTGGQDYKAALEVAEDARGQALQDLMEGRKRQHSRFVNSQGESATKLDSLVVQEASGVRVEPLDDPTVQAASGTASNQYNKIGLVLEAYAEQQVPKLPPLARLVFYVLSDRTAIFAVTPDGRVQGHVVELGEEAIAERVTDLRKALNVHEVSRGLERKGSGAEVRFIAFSILIQTGLYRIASLLLQDYQRKLGSVSLAEQGIPVVKLETLLQDLYAELIAPVAYLLPTDGTPVVIEPHCSLWLVPFAALQLPDGTWMGDRWSLIYAASAYTLNEIRQEPCYTPLANSKILAVGNPIMPMVPDHDGVKIELQPLPGAEAEVKSIVQLFLNLKQQYTLLIGPKATETNVKQLAQSHNIVHLATHGIAYGSDPLASLVAFSPTDYENGLLTAREVIQSSSLPADLVVLSACQTGLGRITGEGMLGLSRAFLVAGARTVVVSQWSVSDSATMELMVAFYKNYLQSGNKAIALQKAMQTVRSHPEYSHPRYWAAFVVVGAEK
ncbi:CHAT domain-containing protein [Microcoleus asticus]|uniref:Photosystem I assembly protein Ycf3 n=1 Tax=Microcoleus asticus IPMA8 TaxID=2563858 RepID=A0ABX2D2H5_9CYAN|nr:CHAT domain-containing protein [Microcoleus asticus]NQE36837.1 Photosystem I assembly protein Ycf3 [Microcoleus asticus IPMA8]